MSDMHPAWRAHGVRSAIEVAHDMERELREAREEIALMREEIESQERAHAEERERWRALVQWHRRCGAYDLGKLQWLGHGHHGGRSCAACAAYEAKVGTEPPMAPPEPQPAQN